MTHKEMLKHILVDIEVMKTSIRTDFTSIGITQKHMRLARNAIEYHKKEAWIEGILDLCRNGK